ncbi:MAG: DUF1549 domain-containing protein [Planctomycetales bacterium]|nr:DUF1549 domain-containing protein [Planctomycetales bacterium]
MSRPVPMYPKAGKLLSCASFWLCLRLEHAIPILLAFQLLLSNRCTFADEAISEVVAAHLAFEHEQVFLSGSDSRWQLVVNAVAADGSTTDVTRSLELKIVPAVAFADGQGYLTPVSNGSAKIIARLPGYLDATLPIEVAGQDTNKTVNFANQIVPIFTKHGCNSGACHGKLAGQAGFKLSLLGFEPEQDYDHLVLESRGRRVFPAAPNQSLILTKAVNSTPHGGGQRFADDSHEYRLLQRWIVGGMPYGDASDPTVTDIEVFPKQRRLAASSTQQISVVAHYSDGSREDITHTAQYESNNKDLADVDSAGLVTLSDQPGSVAIMARYQGHVAVFRVAIPLGASVNELPPVRNMVDELVFAKLKTLGIPPSPSCDDSTFIRRVTLDLCGRLPTSAETIQFIKKDCATKHEALVDRLLNSTDYAEYFAKKWSSILRNRRAGAGHQLGNYAFYDWLRASFHENKPYSQIVRELLTASGSVEVSPAVAWLREVNNSESRVEDTAQLFLGQRIQCARCHHHPFEKWSQADYARLQAFFANVSRKNGTYSDQPMFVSRTGDATARNPRTGQSLPPAGLDSSPASVTATADPRQELVNWMVAEENPFFARSLVNRYWKHFFAIGIVEPEDDMRVTNPPSNSELLEGLSEHFIASGFDLKDLLRLICTSSVYRFSSEANAFNLNEQGAYSRYYPKRLSAEVLLDAVNTVTHSQSDFSGLPPGTRAVCLPDSGFQSYFLDAFGRSSATTACECESSAESTLAQSLHLLNSKEVQSKLNADDGMAATMAASSQSVSELVTELYLASLSRYPTSSEMQAADEYVHQHDNRRNAMEDLVWALINSKEFLFNH